MKRSAFLSMIVCCFALASVTLARTWKDKAGKTLVEGEFVKVLGSSAVLKQADGKVFVVPLTQLSADDQRHIQSLLPDSSSKADPPAIVASKPGQGKSPETAQPSSAAPDRATGTDQESALTPGSSPAPAGHLTARETLTLKGHSSHVLSVDFSPDGRRIVSGGGAFDGTVRVWDAVTGKGILVLRGHKNAVNGVAFSPDGRQIVSGSSDSTLKLWDAATGKEKRMLRHDGSVSCVAFSRDGKRIVGGTKVDVVGFRGKALEIKRVKVWNAATGEEVLTLKGHTRGVTCVAFSPDGKQIVSGSKDDTVKVWNAATGKEAFNFEIHGADIKDVAFSPDGTRIVSGSGGANSMVRVWDATTREKILTLEDQSRSVWCVAFSPDGKHIVSGTSPHVDGAAVIWDVTAGKKTFTLKAHEEGGVFGVAFSPDGKRLVTASLDKTLKVWSVGWKSSPGATVEHPKPNPPAPEPEAAPPTRAAPMPARQDDGRADGREAKWKAGTLGRARGKTFDVTQVKDKTRGSVLFSPSVQSQPPKLALKTKTSSQMVPRCMA